MTRNDKLYAEILLGELRGLPLREAIQQLFERELVDRRTCERLAIRREVSRLVDKGYPVCHALDAAALRCCCSYAKARTAYYEYKP